MDSTVTKYFEIFRKNYTEWNNLLRTFLKTTEKEVWMKDYCKTMVRFQTMYDENKENIANIKNVLNELTPETADILYDQVVKAYLEDYNDAEFLIYVSKRLLDYYKGTDDYSKQAFLYAVISNYLLEVDNPEGKGKNTDITYLTEGMKYIDHYTELDKSARYRIWIMYYNYIVRCVDSKIISLSDALDAYDLIMAFSERPEIKELDKNYKELHELKEYITQTLYIGIGVIDEADPATRRRFYEITKKYFDDNADSITSLYELPSEMYASYLYNEFFGKKIDVDQVFEKYLDYFIYKFQFIKTQSDFDGDELIQCINAINYLTKLGKSVSNIELINRALDVFVDFVQGKWIKNNSSLIFTVNEMLGKVCLSLLSYDTVGIDKEKCITQLIIQRDIYVYIKAKITAEIAEAIYREIAEKNIAFFDRVVSIPKKQWKDYLYHCSMFHDIGEELIMGCLKFRSRPLFIEEAERNACHVEYGTKIFQNIPSIEKYMDAVKGHHSYYNGIGGVSFNYDRNKTDVAPFIDILSLAVYIEEATNPYWDFEQKSKPFPLLINDISSEKNRRFNGELVDLILENKVLQKKIEKIVTDIRDDITYDVSRNWEKIQLSEDEDSIVNEIIEKLEEFKKTCDKEGFKPYFVKLEYLVKNSKNNAVKGKAMHYLMLYYFVTGEYEKGMMLEIESQKLLRESHNYELLSKNYINLGTASLVRNNPEAAMSYFLNGLSFARRTPGCETDENVAYFSLAGIYLMVQHYEKAFEYYNRCNINFLDIRDKLNYLSTYGYCCAKLGKNDLLVTIKEEFEKDLLGNPEYAIYPHYVYLAVFSDLLKLSDELEKNLDILKKYEIKAEEVAFFPDEMFIYIGLLDKLGRYELMSGMLDRYIALVKDYPEYSKHYIRFVDEKIRCLTYLFGQNDYREYEKMISDAKLISARQNSLHMEEVEENLLKAIKIREEHEEYATNQEVLEESIRKAQSDSRQKSQFLSSMSHEIRTPINAILGLNEMILRESNEDDILRYATDIHNAGKQLLGIINDVLDYSKIEAGKMELVPQRYDLGDMINDIKNMMEPKFTEKNLQFIVRYDDSVPSVLYGDDLRIRQILFNLLSNAYKYTKSGFVQFSISYEKKTEQSIIVRFAVKDTGIGLKPDQIEKLAIPFERFDLAKNRGVEGTGLGMSIVMKLLEQMESHLVIESEYDKGSTFSFEIEQGVIEWHRLGRLDENRKKIVQENVARRNRQSLYAPEAKILVVDDNSVNLKVVSALLKRTGVQITCATSGQECLDLCDKNIYHMIFLDHMMPEMDGVETLGVLKKTGGPNSTVPVIALTANVVESVDNFYVRSGFDELLTKPINAERLEELIAYYLPEYLLEVKK